MTYTGEWKECLRHGHGVEQFRNGVIFDGVFSHGRRNGYGTLYYPDGSKVSAIWNGNKVCEYGTMTNLNQNAHYEGAFDQEGNQQPPNFKIRNAGKDISFQPPQRDNQRDIFAGNFRDRLMLN